MSVIQKALCLQKVSGLSLKTWCRSVSFTTRAVRSSVTKVKPLAGLKGSRNVRDYWKSGQQLSAEYSTKALCSDSLTKNPAISSQGTQNTGGAKFVDFYYDREIADMTEEEATRILDDLSEEENKVLRVRKLEFDVMDCNGEYVPKEMTNKMWYHSLRNCHTETRRAKFYKKLAHKEAHARKREIQKVENEAKVAEWKKQKEENPLPEEMFYRRICMTVRKESVVRHQFHQLAFAMQYGSTVCFDFSYEHSMRKVDVVGLAMQMMISYGINKQAEEPFHFHFCNLKSDSFAFERIKHSISNIESVPMAITEDSYLDHYPKDKIIYLSPDGAEEMKEYEPDMVYVIGAIVDKVQIKPVTLAKAKKEGIRHMRLPLDRYLRWKLGNKTLTMDQMTKILLDVCSKKSWPEVLHQHIPQRKLH